MKTPLILAAAALVSLAACKPAPEEVDTRAPDPMASQLANAAPVVVPPSIKASVSFRCKDNSLIFVDFLSDDKGASLRTAKDGPITFLKAPEPGQPFTADGYKLTGTPKAVTLEQPGKGSLACKA